MMLLICIKKKKIMSKKNHIKFIKALEAYILSSNQAVKDLELKVDLWIKNYDLKHRRYLNSSDKRCVDTMKQLIKERKAKLISVRKPTDMTEDYYILAQSLHEELYVRSLEVNRRCFIIENNNKLFSHEVMTFYQIIEEYRAQLICVKEEKKITDITVDNSNLTPAEEFYDIELETSLLILKNNEADFLKTVRIFEELFETREAELTRVGEEKQDQIMLEDDYDLTSDVSILEVELEISLWDLEYVNERFLDNSHDRFLQSIGRLQEIIEIHKVSSISFKQ